MWNRIHEKRRQCERACFVFAVGFWNCGFICCSWSHNAVVNNREHNGEQKNLIHIEGKAGRLLSFLRMDEQIQRELDVCCFPCGASCAVFHSNLRSKKIARIKLHQFSNTQSPPCHNLIYISTLKTIAGKQLLIKNELWIGGIGLTPS